MEASSFAFRRNLEPLGSERRAGEWRISDHVDHVSERRFTLSVLRSESAGRTDAATVVFRVASATDISPACPGVIDVLVDNGRIELLTPYAETIDPESLDESTAHEVIEQLVGTLAKLEEHAFVATDVRLGAIAVDERGRMVLLPGAYALAPGLGDEVKLPVHVGVDVHVHAVARVMGEILEHVGTTAGPFAERLARTAGEVASGRMGTIAELSVALFDRSPGGGREWSGSETGANVMSGRVSEVNNLLASHSLVIIEGGDESGKSATLHGLYEALRQAGKPVRRIDEWSLSSRPRRKGGPEKNAGTDVWLVDDVGEKPTLYAPLFDRIALSGEDTRVVWSLSTQTAPACEAFLQGIRARAHAAAATVHLEGSGESPSRVGNALAVLSPHETPPESGTFGDLLAALTPEERRILELAAVARIPLPLSFLSSVFAETEGGVRPHLHRPGAARLLEIDYQALPPSGMVGATITIAGASLRRTLYEQIPESRRRVLHRTIARLADSQGGFPPMEIYRHLVLGREYTAAGKCAVAFLGSASREERAPFLEQLTRELVDTKRYETLDYENQLRLLVSIGSDLCERGKQDEAERLLVLARDVEGDSDDVRVHASLVSEAMQLLADTWMVRSNYTQALDLLQDTREELNPYLSLAQQARLMNEIGWLQYRLGDYNTAVESCKLSLNTLNPNEHPLVVAQALNLMGVIHYNTSRYDEAISYYEQSAILREKEGDRNALAGSFNNLALAYQSKGEYDKALESYEKSLTIKKEQNNEAGIAAGYLNQALLFLEVHNFDEAERKCQDSLALASNLAIAQLIAKNNSTLGDIALTRGRFDDAERYYRQSLALARSIETTNEEMGALRRLAHLYLTRERLAEAREAVEEAARLAHGLGSKYETARIDEILGDINRAEGHYARAIEFYEKAASAYTTVSKYRFAAASLAKIGHAQIQSGDSFEARHYLDRANDVIRSQIGHEIPDEIVTLQQMLRELPQRPTAAFSGTDAQKLFYAFYELSSLSEYADDRTSICKRVVSVFKDLTGASLCYLGLQAEEGNFVRIDETGEQQPVTDPSLRALLARTTQLGTLLHSASEDCADIAGGVAVAPQTGFVCVPLKSAARSLGCVFLQVAESSLPLSRDEANFIGSIGRHVAGDLRLSFHLEEHAHKEETLEMEFETLKAQVVDRYDFKNLVGKDESMKKIFRILDKVKDMDTGILFIGESGTGKTELARTIHYNSPRRQHLFQQIHCAEIPTSLLESELFGHERGAFTGAVQRKLGRCEVADRGTIFLDDVNVMPTETQSKLLHYLESKSFTRLGGTKKISTDVRIIAASNEDLEKLVEEGRFREDLYYRLKVIQIELPPLRERLDDMIAIAQVYLKRRCQEQGKALKTLSTETIKLFRKYSWPGNVRELQNILEQIVLLSDDDIAEPSSLPEDFLKRTIGGGRQQWQTLEALAEQMVATENYSEAAPLMPQLEAMLARKMADHIEHKGRAASFLGITKPTLYNRLRGYDKMK